MHAPLVLVPDDATARALPATATLGELAAVLDDVVSLDGDWAFQLFDNPGAVPDDAVAPGVVPTTGDGRSGWCGMRVPANWQIEGVRRGLALDVPQYTNVRMPFTEQAPRTPEHNPTAVYRRTVTIPRTWAGRRIVLGVDGADSAVVVHVNGEPVGMGKDSRLASEFDLTQWCTPGRKITLALVVTKFCDASHIEDQDAWWLSGLHRSVWLAATDHVHLADVAVTASWEPDPPRSRPTKPPTGASTATSPGGTAGLSLTATVAFDLPGGATEAGWHVTGQLETLGGRRIATLTPTRGIGEVPSARYPYLFSGHDVHLTAPEGALAQVRPWSAEDPVLYRILVRLVDPDGHVCSVAAIRTGFRSVEVRDRQLLINGAPVGIRGVNRHDHHPDRGAAVTVEDLRTDLCAMKAANVNAVRCAHYPNDWRLLEMCNELGLYVIDEANVESHAANTSLCHDPRYRNAILERVARMVIRDRNHPSVIAWSLGNESGYGAAHDAAAAWVRRVDPTRPLHYEGAVMEDLYAEAPVTDIVCPMYASPEQITQWSDSAADTRRPLILCEFSHAMGNSNGGLDTYVEAFETLPGIQGGFIWEWKDHGIRQRLANGRERFAYGGQFGDEPNDLNFVADGLVGPDGTPHPALTEWAWLCRPVTATAPGGRPLTTHVTVTNRQWFTDTSWLTANVTVTVDGEPVRTAALPFGPVPPRGTARVPLPDTVVALLAAARGRRPWPGRKAPPTGAEVHLTVRFAQRRTTPWAPRGHVVGWDQITLPPVTHRRRARAPSTGSRAGVVRVTGDPVTTITADLPGAPLEVVFNHATASVQQVTRGGSVLVARGPQLEVFRAAIDNDGMKLALGNPDPWLLEQTHLPLPRWVAAGLPEPTRTAGSVTVVNADDTSAEVCLERTLGFAHGVTIGHTTVVTVTTGGSVRFDDTVEVPDDLDDLPRLGVSFELPAHLRWLRWFGLGPDESYPDRCASSLVAVHALDVADTYVPYVMPQHHGTRGGLRWVTFMASPGGSRSGSAPWGVRVTSDGPGGTPGWFTARLLTDTELWDAPDVAHLLTPDELTNRNVTVHLDARVRGLGTASCGPAPADEHRIRPGRYQWSWTLAAEQSRRR
jgi:beta-galactosidase